jgi:inhibitor of cysteine peptidase
MLIIDETWNGREAEVVVGDVLKLELSENPTTGYRWRMPDVGLTLRILNDSCQAAAKGPGSAGVRRWTLAADKDGVVPLRLGLKRSWQSEPAQTFTVTLAVKAR